MEESKYFNLKLPKKTFVCLKKASADLDVSMTDLANFALEKYLSKIKNNHENVLTYQNTNV